MTEGKLSMNGADPLGEWLTQFKFVKKWGPNIFTFFRLFTATAFCGALHYLPECLPVLCFLDAFLDLSDGPVARALDQKTEFGGYFDQAMDKFSNLLRLFYLFGLAYASHVELITPYILIPLIFLIFIFDITNFVIRSIEFFSSWFTKKKAIGQHPEDKKEKPVSFPAGKIKAWFQAFAIYFLSTIWIQYCIETKNANLGLFIFFLALTAVGIVLIANKLIKSLFKRVMAILGFVSFMVIGGVPNIETIRVVMTIIIFIIAVILGFMSTSGQILRRTKK